MSAGRWRSSAPSSRPPASSPTARHGSTTPKGPTDETTAALFRAKYVVGEAVAHIARVALTLSGSHGIFKGGRIEQLYRDGALGPLHAPPSDFCLWNMGIHELGLDPAEVPPPLEACDLDGAGSLVPTAPCPETLDLC